MDETIDPLEVLWDQLLSRQPDQVRGAFASLNAAEKQHILAHLHRMTAEPGWHAEQRKSARAALEALGEKGPPTGDRRR